MAIKIINICKFKKQSAGDMLQAINICTSIATQWPGRLLRCFKHCVMCKLKCDGVHKTLDDLYGCKECDQLFQGNKCNGGHDSCEDIVACADCAEFLDEMDNRGERMYLASKWRVMGEIVMGIVLFVLFIAAVYGYMLVFPD